MAKKEKKALSPEEAQEKADEELRAAKRKDMGIAEEAPEK